MKKISIVVTVLFLINFISLISAVKIGISDSKIDFSGKINEEMCNKITVYSDYDGFLIGKTKWAKSKEFEKDLRYYILNYSDIGVKIDYPERVKVNEKKEIEICLTGEKPGDYFGALLYSTENSYAGVGVWIYANIYGEETKQEKTSLITGKIASDSVYYGSNKTQILLLESSTVLLSFFLMLLLISKNLMSSK